MFSFIPSPLERGQNAAIAVPAAHRRLTNFQCGPDIPGVSTSRRDPGADGAAAFLRTGAGVDNGFPDVTLAALPPDLAVGPGRDHGRRQRAVEGGVPLGRDLRDPGRQVVKPGQDLRSRAVGAAAALTGPACNPGQIVVAPLTAPPDLPVGAGGDLIRRQSPVFAGVPLGRDFRI